MRFIKILATIFAVGVFSLACNLNQPNEITDRNSYPNDVVEGDAAFDESSYPARENLDLQAVGALLERADNAEEFEYLLNSEGVNNLDLNDDGYVDYISVREFDDRDDDERGFSLFSMFGPDEILEIATIIFDREGLDYPGAKILLTGNEQLYGDDYYYEANWLDRSLAIVNWLFNDRDDIYRSPYYVDNYPDYYEVYRVVETPVYQTRVEQFYPQPVFIRTVSPTIAEIKIESPYSGKSAGKIYSKPAKLTKEEKAFRKNNPNPPEFVPVKKGKIKDFSFAVDDKPKGNPKNFDNFRKINKTRPDVREKPIKIWKEEQKSAKLNKVQIQNVQPFKIQKQNIKPPKPDNNGKNNNGGNKGGGKGGGKRGKN